MRGCAIEVLRCHLAADLKKTVENTVDALGYELVDLEMSSRGLVRVFIDQAQGISVGDCEKVSNHLLRVFAVEGIDFDRLEVSSPGLDRPLKTALDFDRFAGSRVKVRLLVAVEGRKRFDALLRGVDGGMVRFAVLEANADAKQAKARGKPATGSKPVRWKEVAELKVPLSTIEKVRLAPDLG
ncbi:MAG: ribosome maturation factor RimP [Betaproteobacteria bacterium]|nr:ribosome maturation factor RimP [Betaproteobacteria bacterium]